MVSIADILIILLRYPSLMQVNSIPLLLIWWH